MKKVLYIITYYHEDGDCTTSYAIIARDIDYAFRILDDKRSWSKDDKRVKYAIILAGISDDTPSAIVWTDDPN